MSGSPVTCSIELTVIGRIKAALYDAKENAAELLAIHDSSLGRTTKKNTYIATMHENEIKECEELINNLKQFAPLGDF